MKQFNPLPAGPAAEAIHPTLAHADAISGVLFARKKSWEAMDLIKPQVLVEGISEVEARKIILQSFLELGVKTHWHQPYVRFGPGTKCTYADPLRDDHRLKMNDPVYIDIGPVWLDEKTGIKFEGDVGDSFVFGENKAAEHCGTAVRQLFAETKAAWHSEQWSGPQIYEYLRTRARSLGYSLLSDVDGHRIGDFPHQRYSKEGIPNLHFHPSAHLWILEIQIVHDELPIAAFYEDLLF